MRYLGIDVHVASIVFHVLDDTGQTLEQGKIDTRVQALSALVTKLGKDELLVGQEVGKMSYFVHDVLTELGVKVLSFNAHHLRMIAASRKKTDKRDAYWIANALQTEMTPHPVYIPTGEVRELRALLSRRSALVTERRRWLLRARSYLQAAGHKTPAASRSVKRLIDVSVSEPEGMDGYRYQALSLCQRMEETLTLELLQIEHELMERAQKIDAIARLKTIPSIGDRVSEAAAGEVQGVRSQMSWVRIRETVVQIGRPFFPHGNMCRSAQASMSTNGRMETAPGSRRMT